MFTKGNSSPEKSAFQGESRRLRTVTGMTESPPKDLNFPDVLLSFGNHTFFWGGAALMPLRLEGSPVRNSDLQHGFISKLGFSGQGCLTFTRL